MGKKQEKIVLGESCSIKDPAPCDMKVSISVAAQTARELNLPIYGKLQRIQNKGVISKTEASKTLHLWAEQVNAAPQASTQHKNWADIVTAKL